jgi:tetratricopeptide (TPR) repeat protein
MSVTTVASSVLPDRALLQLPPSRPERFQRSDFIAAGLVFITTFIVYLITMAPNVGLEDSGELVTGAAKFGVPHPPGYPLWTMSGFLFSHLIPFGNLSWRVNLQSAVFGAAANGVLTLLVCHSGRWLLQRWTEEAHQPFARRYCFYAGMLAGMTLGFSDVMWSQAVIAEVYTLNALFVNLVLLFFYLWMLEPRKTHRLIFAVFVFSLGLTNHHTLVQIIPAFLLAALLLQLVPFVLGKPATAPAGTFWSVCLAVNLFSLSILVYISWLSADLELHAISLGMANLIFLLTAGVSFFYLKEFRLRLFLLGVGTMLAIFAYGHFMLGPSEINTERYSWGHPGRHFWNLGSLVRPGWLQITTAHGLFMVVFGSVAGGLLFTSKLDRRMVIGVFAAGWVGLMPYAYERFASNTHPPMNWGYTSERAGFYYAVSREQYPASLPNLIKHTFGHLLHLSSAADARDIALNDTNYLHRLWLTFYYYGDNLQDNFTVPLIFLTLAILVYVRRCDAAQWNWFGFLAVAFFFLGFIFHIITPPESFDFERNIQYKVFHLQSHCIFVLLMGYGALAAMTYLHESVPEIPEKTGVMGIGMPALYLSLMPLWSNFNDCNQAGHWFGYNFGADIMRPMDKDAVYLGGTDFGRFVPTYMAFVESQQEDRWKREPGFDRRDVTVITQNALCDTYYCHYIRDQYDARFRPARRDYTPFERWLGRDRAYPEKPVICPSPEELSGCWDKYEALPYVIARVKSGGPVVRPGTSDVFELNGIVAQELFEKNKKEHTFYLEQSIPIEWMYPYLLPCGLIFKMNPDPMDAIPQEAIDEDRKFWDAYSQRLLRDPQFRLDDDAVITFSKLAYWHADLYHWRHLLKEEEYWLKLSLALCPQMVDAAHNLAVIEAQQGRYDEAIAVVKQAELDDPRNESYASLLDWVAQAKVFSQNEKKLREELEKTPRDVALNVEMARLLQDEGKLNELDERMRITAGLTNWDRASMADLVQYYVDKVHNPSAAIAFLETRAQLDPKSGELIYSLAGLHALMGHRDDAMKYLLQAVSVGGTNAILSAEIDPRFAGLRDDPRFQALTKDVPLPVMTNGPMAPTAKPVKK